MEEMPLGFKCPGVCNDNGDWTVWVSALISVWIGGLINNQKIMERKDLRLKPYKGSASNEAVTLNRIHN